MDERVVVDASVWISRLTPQDVNYSASSLWATHFTSKGGLLVVPKFLLIEVAGAISRLTGDSAVAKKIGCHPECCVKVGSKQASRDAREVQPVPGIGQGRERPRDFQKASPEKAVKSGQEPPRLADATQDIRFHKISV